MTRKVSLQTKMLIRDEMSQFRSSCSQSILSLVQCNLVYHTAGVAAGGLISPRSADLKYNNCVHV